MAIMKGSRKYQLDAELVLRASTAAAITATGASLTFDLGAMGAYWNGTDGEVAGHQLAVVIDVAALVTGGMTPETYEFQVQTDSAAAFDDAIITSFKLAVAATGEYVFLLDVDTLRKLDVNAKFLRLNAVLAGTAPSLTYNAFVAPIHPYA